MNIKRIASHSFVQGGFLFTFIQLFVGFLSYIFNSLSAKVLGPKGYSELAAFTAYTIVLNIPVMTFTTDIIRRLGSMTRDQSAAVARWEAILYGLLKKYIYALPLILALAYLFGSFTNIHFFTAFILLCVALANIYWGFYMASFQALHWFGLYALVMLSVSSIRLLGPVILIPPLSSLDSILVIVLAANIITIFLGKWLFSKRHKPVKTDEKKVPTSLRRIFTNKILLMTMFSFIAMNLLNNLDVMIARKSLSAYEAGLYAAWSLFAKIIFYVTGPLTSLSLIFFASEKFKKHHTKTLFVILIMLAVVGVTLALFYTIAGRFLILIVFSKEYLPINKYLPLAGIFGVVYSSIFFFNNFYLSKASKYSLIGLVAIPFYAVALLMFGKTSVYIIQINIIFSAVLLIFYILSVLHYNIQRWNKRKPNTS